MGMLDSLAPKSRLWKRQAEKCAREVMRAASVQAHACGMANIIGAARELARQYQLEAKAADWHEYGDVAFHLVTVWPPDLAYAIIYAFREVKHGCGYDPVPLVLKAVEMMYCFKPAAVTLHLPPTAEWQKMWNDPQERLRASAKILAREISGVPLRWASGIYRALDTTVKPVVLEQVRHFNPAGAAILERCGYSWLFTKSGLLRVLFRTCFGREA